MVDISKIKVGDEVTVRGKVVSLGAATFFIAFPDNEDGPTGTCLNASIRPRAIVTHTPAPREFKPGDPVYAGKDLAKYELVGIRGDLAFLWLGEQNFARTALSKDLIHADESE